jgi:hypothetical protein
MKLIEVKKSFYIRIIVIALIAALFVPMVVSGGIFRQAGFGFGEYDAKFYINGIQYGGDAYLTESSLLSAQDNSEVFGWEENRISFDIDGEIGNKISASRDYPANLADIEGLKPDMSFEISNSLQLVDLYGNPLTSGYTRKDKTSDGFDMYIYHYSCDLMVDAKAGKTATASLTETSPGGSSPNDIWAFRIDGVSTATEGMTEIGVIDNIYALLSVDFPDITDWTFGWEVHIDGVDADLKSTRTGEVFKETEYEDYIDSEYIETSSVIFYDPVFHININNPIRRSHSVEGRVTQFIADGEEVGAIGVDQMAIPGAYHGAYTGFYTGLVTGWDLLEPTLIYNIILKVSAVDGRDTNGDGNETTTTTTTTDGNGGFDPLKGFNWKEFVEEMSFEQKVMLGGATFVLVMIVLLFRRRQGGY